MKTKSFCRSASMIASLLLVLPVLLLAPGPSMGTPEVDDDDDDRGEWDEWMVPTAPGAGHEPGYVTAASAALIRGSQTWQRVAINELELKQIDQY